MTNMDQDAIMDNVSTKIKNSGIAMRKSLETNDLKAALKHAKAMLAELRTNLVTPRNYYNLYMQVFNEMKLLEQAFVEEQRKSRKIGKIYKLVQESETILPRLYLMITIGSAYIQSKEVPTKEILKDLLGMVKGIQNPMRGLFLRYFLLKMMKDYLPDEAPQALATTQEGTTTAPSDIDESITFILQNLKEMNRLWIRMTHQGTKDKAQRETERNDLRVTVGENIIRMSNLEGITKERYVKNVFPELMEIVQECKDTLSQQYLMDCIISAFPDEYHLFTLEGFLKGCSELQPNIDLKAIYINLLNRLSQYFSNNKSANTDAIKSIDVYTLFKNASDKIISEQGASDFKKLLELEISFMKFCIKTYPSNVGYINSIMESCVKIVDLQGKKSFDNDSLKQVMHLLITPLEALGLSILEMPQYPVVMQYLQPKMRKDVAKKVLKAIINVRHNISSSETMKKLFTFIPTLIEDDPEIVEEQYEFDETQLLMCKLVHMVNTPNLEDHCVMLNMLKDLVKLDDPKRIKSQYPTLAFAYCNLITEIHTHGKDKSSTSPDVSFSTQKILEIFKIVIDMCKLMKPIYPELAIHTLLFGLLIYSKIGHNDALEDIANEYATITVEIFEEEITDSETMMKIIYSIVAHLQIVTSYSSDNFVNICKNLTKVCAKLLKKQDQIRSILACTHLFYSKSAQEKDFVQQCIKKCTKICDSCKAAKKNMGMYMCILNKQMYYYAVDDEIIKASDINETIATIAAIIANRAASEAELKTLTASFEHFKSILALRIERASNEALKKKFTEIII